MTVLEAQRMTWGEVPTFVANEVTKTTGWSLIEDTTTSGSFTYGDYVAFTSPQGDDFLFRGGSSNDDYLRVYCGADYAGGGTWNDLYGNNYFGPGSNANANRWEYAVDVWIAYDAGGFLAYVSQKEGTGYDSDCAIGMSEVTPVWDYSTAANRESPYTYLFHSAYQTTWANDVMPAGDIDTNYSITAEGCQNPDANFQNYVRFEESLLRSTQYQNASNGRPVIGTHSRWLLDRSEDATAHGDRIQDQDGNDTYIILKEWYSDDPDTDRPLAMKVV